jgi:DNA-binding transcriptional ArsR family regulator
MSRKVNKYFVTVPVSDWQDAKLLGSETNWKILEALRDVGINGLSAQEISEKIRVPIASIYNNLSKLTAAKLIESTARRQHWGRPSKEAKQHSGKKPTGVYIESVPWGESEFDEEFIKSLDPILEDMEKNVSELGEKWLSILDKIASTYQTNDLKRFFPQDAIHETCGRSHEGLEFLYAISIALLWKILEGKHFEELATKHKFMKAST